MQTATSKKNEPSVTRERLIEAALRVYARDGLSRATTRVIAEEAGVNEVTLFRHFQNKEGLLSEAMRHFVESMGNQDIGEEEAWTSNLKENLRRFATGLYDKMVQDEAFVRTMVGEAHRHPEHARTIILDTVRPIRARFVQNLEAARAAGCVRQDVDLNIAVEAFTSMLLGGMLKITANCSEGYTGDDYVAVCVDLFYAGIATPQGVSASVSQG